MDRSLWTDEELEIFDLFHGRCGLNRAHKAEVLHEIVPKSQAPNAWDIPTNRIPLCSKCHTYVHSIYNARMRNRLREIRLEAENAKFYTKQTNI